MEQFKFSAGREVVALDDAIAESILSFTDSNMFMFKKWKALPGLIGLLVTSGLAAWGQPNTVDISDTWQIAGTSFSATIQIIQTGANLSGQLTFSGNQCPSSSFSGTLGAALSPFAFILYAGPVYLVGGFNPDANSIGGQMYDSASGGTVSGCASGNWIGRRSPISLNTIAMTFSYETAGQAAAAQQLILFSKTATPFNVSTTGGSWFAVSPVAGTAPTALAVTVNPSSLLPNIYTGTITITSSNTGGPTGGPAADFITLKLVVTDPVPSISGVRNAASGATGPVAPGEIISIYSTGNSIGPTSGVGLQLDQSGKVATTLGGVQVLFLPVGIYAPLTYVSAGQINAVVPYEMAGVPNLQVAVIYKNQQSKSFMLQGAATAPGIFTANGSGTGPGAILNDDGATLNGPSTPEPRGGFVVLYVTGEGQTVPAGVSGKVTSLSPVPPLTPIPILPPTVMINDQPAFVSFSGEAPGLVSGVMQVNVQIPLTAMTGDLPIQVSMGGVSSQKGVTVSVK